MHLSLHSDHDAAPVPCSSVPGKDFCLYPDALYREDWLLEKGHVQIPPALTSASRIQNRRRLRMNFSLLWASWLRPANVRFIGK